MRVTRKDSMPSNLPFGTIGCHVTKTKFGGGMRSHRCLSSMQAVTSLHTFQSSRSTLSQLSGVRTNARRSQSCSDSFHRAICASKPRIELRKSGASGFQTRFQEMSQGPAHISDGLSNIDSDRRPVRFQFSWRCARSGHLQAEQK